MICSATSKGRILKVLALPPLQVLFKNQWTVLYCTLLAKAKSSSEREAIEEEMRADPLEGGHLECELYMLLLCMHIYFTVCTIAPYAGV